MEEGRAGSGECPAEARKTGPELEQSIPERTPWGGERRGGRNRREKMGQSHRPGNQLKVNSRGKKSGAGADSVERELENEVWAPEIRKSAGGTGL
jgi:hypothetical protein